MVEQPVVHILWLKEPGIEFMWEGSTHGQGLQRLYVAQWKSEKKTFRDKGYQALLIDRNPLN